MDNGKVDELTRLPFSYLDQGVNWKNWSTSLKVSTMLSITWKWNLRQIISDPSLWLEWLWNFNRGIEHSVLDEHTPKN